MEAASLYCLIHSSSTALGVTGNKRYSGQQEIASKKSTYYNVMLCEQSFNAI